MAKPLYSKTVATKEGKQVKPEEQTLDHVPPAADVMIGYAEAAALLGVPVGTLYHWVHRRRVPHVRLGPRLVRFGRGQLLSWLDAHRVPTTGCH